ncbi:hypothetical protein ACI782_21405 [Geodermatophilus sp. SYSU D00703]
MTAGRGSPAPRRPATVAVGAAVLTLAAAVVGTAPWPLPRQTPGWQVADVPASLLALVGGTAGVCLALAGILVRPASLPGRVVPALWWLVVLASAVALGWNALRSAALSDLVVGAVLPVLDRLLAFLPAAVVGLATRRAGTRPQLRAVLGTAVVSVPLFTLGWALLDSSPGIVGVLEAPLHGGTLLGALPVLLAVAGAAALAREPDDGPALPG